MNPHDPTTIESRTDLTNALRHLGSTGEGWREAMEAGEVGRRLSPAEAHAVRRGPANRHVKFGEDVTDLLIDVHIEFENGQVYNGKVWSAESNLCTWELIVDHPGFPDAEDLIARGDHLWVISLNDITSWHKG